MNLEERVLGHHIWIARLEDAVNELSRHRASPDKVRDKLRTFAKEAIASLCVIPIDPPKEWSPASFTNFFCNQEANGHKAWIETDDGSGYQLALQAYDHQSAAYIREIQPVDHWRVRMDLAHLLHFLVTLCRVYEGEIPDGKGYEHGPWNEIAKQALLPMQ